MTDAVKSYVITYTENKQHHEVVWHALSVKDALWSMEASYIDPSDFQQVSNVQVYEVVSAQEMTELRTRLAALTLAVGERDETINERDQTVSALRAQLRNSEQTLRNLGLGFLTGDGKEIAMNESYNITMTLNNTEPAAIAETAPATEAGK